MTEQSRAVNFRFEKSSLLQLNAAQHIAAHHDCRHPVQKYREKATSKDTARRDSYARRDGAPDACCSKVSAACSENEVMGSIPEEMIAGRQAAVQALQWLHHCAIYSVSGS